MKIVSAALGAAFLLAAAQSALGQVQCAPASAVAESLGAAGLAITVSGTDSNGARFEIWADERRGWVLVVTPSAHPDLRCGIAGGEDLRLRGSDHPPAPPERESL